MRDPKVVKEDKNFYLNGEESLAKSLRMELEFANLTWKSKLLEGQKYSLHSFSTRKEPITFTMCQPRQREITEHTNPKHPSQKIQIQIQPVTNQNPSPVSKTSKLFYLESIPLV